MSWISRLQFLRLVYVDGFVRLSEMPFSLALVRIAYSPFEITPALKEALNS
jgi:hypothetical protein